MKLKEEKILRYGEKIILKSSDTEKSYYLAGKSVHLPTAYFLIENRNLKGIEHFYSGITEMIFELTPRLYFEASQNLAEVEPHNPKKNLYMKRKQVEDELNKTIMESSRGKPVRLGDHIQLFHPATGLYLRVTSTKSQSGDFNLVTLDKRISQLCQFEIKSNLAFRKSGSFIFLADDFYLKMATKTLAYPLDDLVIKRSVIQFTDGRTGDAFVNRKKKKELRLPDLTEAQTMMKPIQAGNVITSTYDKRYSNKFKAMKVDVSFDNTNDILDSNYRWGDYLLLSKLDKSGLGNALFCQCNQSGLVDVPLIKFIRENKYKDMRGYESIFQIIPKRSELLGKPINFNENNEVMIYLRHYLTGKFLYFSREENILKLAQDYGVFFEYIHEIRSTRQSEYKDAYKEYQKIMSDESIKDKQVMIKNKFPSSMVKLFKSTDQIIETEDRYDDQYLREISLTLVKFTKGETSNLQNSSYFSIRTHEGTYIKALQDTDRLEKLIKEKAKEVNDSFFEKTFNIEEFYGLHFCTGTNEAKEADFFYLEQPKDLDYNPKQMDYCLSDLVRYCFNNSTISTNLTSASIAVQFLKHEIKSPSMTKNEFQNYLRESCVIDILMKVLIKIYNSDFEKNSSSLISLFNKCIAILGIFVQENEFSANYCYQWKKFYSKFLEDPRLLRGKTNMNYFIAKVFEKTGNYDKYLEFNLKPICKSIEFKYYDRPKLRQFLEMLRTCVKMKNPLIDEYVLKTVVFSDFKDKIFYPFSLSEYKVAEVKVTKAVTLTMDANFCITQELELDYIVDLVSAAAILIQIAPNRVALKMKESFPKEVCISIALDKSLDGKLRGAFITAYKNLYIMSELPKYDIAKVNTNVIIPEQPIPYVEIQKSKTKELRRVVLKSKNSDIVNLILNGMDFDDDGLTIAMMDLSYYILFNRLLVQEEVEVLERNLKKILRLKGSSDQQSSIKRQITNKHAIKTLREISLQFDVKIDVSLLQEKEWMPNLIKCLIEIEKIKNQNIWQEFAIKEAEPLEIDFLSVVKKYSDPYAENRGKLMKRDRDRLKVYMDERTSGDLVTPIILIGLINPDKGDLSIQVFKYLNLLLKRDELTLENYSHKFVLQKKLDPIVKKDFIKIFEMTYRAIASSKKLSKAIEQKEKSKVSSIFGKFLRNIERINQKIFIQMREGDRQKKIETCLEMYSNKEIEFSEEVELKDPLSINPKEKSFYVNILNHFIGNTVHYKFRKAIFIDLSLPTFILHSLLEVYEFMRIYKLKKIVDYDTEEKTDQFYINPILIEGGNLSDDFKKAVVKCFLILNYVFLTPSHYNKSFVENNLDNLIKITDLVFRQGGKNLKLFVMKFMAILMKNNMSVLVKINTKLIHLFFDSFKMSLKQKDFQTAHAFLELFQIIIEFRGVSFVENSYIISSEILNTYNLRDSILKDIMENRLIQLLKNNSSKSLEKKLEFVRHRWDSLRSEAKEQVSLTREHNLVFKSTEISAELLICYKIFMIFRTVLSINQPAITELVKNAFSLGHLLKICDLAEDWWPIKSSVISLITTLYINDRISERNFDILSVSLEKCILKDIQYFEQMNKKAGLTNDEIFYSEIVSISSHNLEETVYKPFFGVIAFNKNESLKDYVVNKVHVLLQKLFATLSVSIFLPIKDITVFRAFKKVYSESNFQKNRNASFIGFRPKGANNTETTDKNFNDAFLTKFGVKDNSEEIDLIRKKKLMSKTESEMILFRSSFLTSLMGHKISNYVKKVDQEFDLRGSGREDMFINIRELLNKNFLEEVNAEDYNEFIDEVIEHFKENQMKKYIFLSDLVRLLKPRGISFVRLERIINILKKIVERSKSPKKTIKILGKLGLFPNIVQKYTENRYNVDVCMILAKFTILCNSYGMELVQKSILNALYYDVSNSYINSIRRNISTYFDKFYQREVLRNSFIGREMMNKQLQEDLDGPIEEASQVFMTHLEMLRFFCEGHYIKMQNYLRTQVDEGKYKPNQVNFLAEMERCLKLYSKVMTSRNTSVGMKILEFLVEMIQGPCEGNQFELTKLKIIETLEEISTTLIYELYDIDEEVKSGMINQICLIILGSLESNYNNLIISKVALNTNCEALWERLVQIYSLTQGTFHKYSNPIVNEIRNTEKVASKMLKGVFGKRTLALKKKKRLADNKTNMKAIASKGKKRYNVYEEDGKDYTLICQEGINISVIFNLLMSFGDEYSGLIEKEYSLKKLGPNKEMLPRTRRFFFSKVKSIEIINQSGELERIFYPLPAITRFHSNFSKDDFEENVERKTANSKLTGLIEIVPYTLYELNYFAWLSKKGLMANLSIVRILRYINFIWAFIINLIMLSFPVPDISDESEGSFEFSLAKMGSLSSVSKLLYSLVLLLLLSNILTLTFWFILEFSLERYKIKLDETRKIGRKHVATNSMVYSTKEAKKKAEEGDKRREVVSKNVSSLKVAWRIMTETYLFFMAILIGCCILGMAFSKLFLSFLLLDVITLSPNLQNVMKAVTLRIRSLSITFWFGIIQIFVYASLTFYSKLRTQLTFIDNDQLEMCTNFFHCFIMMMNFGMRAGGGIGETLLYPQYEDSKNLYLFRTFFDLVFFITINMVLLEIVFGLIVDSFGELREIRTTKRKSFTPYLLLSQ